MRNRQIRGRNELFFRYNKKTDSGRWKTGMRRVSPDAPVPCPPARSAGGCGREAASEAYSLRIRRDGSAECVCDAENEVQRLPEKLGERPHGGGEGECPQPPESVSPSLSDHLLVVAVRPFRRSPVAVENVPFVRAPQDGADKTGVLVGGHDPDVSSDLVAVRALRTFLCRTDMAADVPATLRIVVVLPGTAQPSARSIRDAVHVVTSFQECIPGEILSAGIVPDDGDSPVSKDIHINVLLIIGGVEEMHLPGENWDRPNFPAQFPPISPKLERTKWQLKKNGK